jgi:hypothetical protein
MLRTKLVAATAHWNRGNQWDGGGAYDLSVPASIKRASDRRKQVQPFVDRIAERRVRGGEFMGDVLLRLRAEAS